MVALDQKIEAAIDRHFETCKVLADYITDNPELGMEENKAVAAYKTLLENAGYDVETPYRGVPCSFRAVKKERAGSQAKRAVVMCEYDALPEIGHACGHSVSGSASVLAALALSSAYPNLPLRVDIMGTPGEEYPGGKELLLREKAFDGYEFAAMAHMASGNHPVMKALACNDRYIAFKGKSSHASACPQGGINALNAARLYMDAMDLWRQHMPPNAQFHGVVAKGGDLPSMVPENVELNFYFRGVTLADLDRVCEISDKCAQGAAFMTDCTYTSVQRYLTNADLCETRAGNNLIRDIFEAMGESCAKKTNVQGSTDAGNVDQIIPVFHPMVNVAPPGENIAIHTSEFQKLMHCESAHQGLKNAGRLLAYICFNLAVHNELLQAIQEEHRRFRGLSHEVLKS